jgi:hypothetical protein
MFVFRKKTNTYYEKNYIIFIVDGIFIRIFAKSERKNSTIFKQQQGEIWINHPRHARMVYRK